MVSCFSNRDLNRCPPEAVGSLFWTHKEMVHGEPIKVNRYYNCLQWHTKPGLFYLIPHMNWSVYHKKFLDSFTLVPCARMNTWASELMASKVFLVWIELSPDKIIDIEIIREHISLSLFSIVTRLSGMLWMGHNASRDMPFGTLLMHDDVIKWKHFPRNWPFVRGIHRSRWIPHTKASDAELWCFLWSAYE